MENYENKIMELLAGETPKEKYETLLSLIIDSNQWIDSGIYYLLAGEKVHLYYPKKSIAKTK